MTVSTQDSKAVFDADGSTDTFTYTFRVDNDQDLIVYLGETVQVSGYTLTRAGDGIGGSVVFDANPTGIVTLQRKIDFTQETDYVAYDAFPADSHEQALDKLTMLTQQLSEELSRVPSEPIGAPNPEDGYSHNQTENRAVAGCHPVSAITDLQLLLDGKEPADSTILKDADIGIAANQLVQLDATAKLPAVDGSQLTNVAALGVGQTWQDVKASRALGVTYTNSTGKPVVVAYTSSGTAFAATATLYIEGVAISRHNSLPDQVATLEGIVPNGSTYRVSHGGGASIDTWAELR